MLQLTSLRITFVTILALGGSLLFDTKNSDSRINAKPEAPAPRETVPAGLSTNGWSSIALLVQQAYLKGSNSEYFDGFGTSVAVSGDTVVVGALFEDSGATGVNGDASNNSEPESGAVFVFVRNGSNWVQQAYLKASNTGIGDAFGNSVSISGDTLVVGARSEASKSMGVNGNETDNSVEAAGAAYVFVRSGTTWTQQAYLKASNTGELDYFGWSVSISGDTIVVGAPQESSNAVGVNGNQFNNNAVRSGAAYVFARTGTTWSQQAYLKASNTGTDDRFGFSVSVSGDTIAVGADIEDSAATGVNGDQTNNNAAASGAVYIYVRTGTSWSQQAYLKASNTEAIDYFGTSVAVSGDTVVIGAEGEDSNAVGVNGDQSNNSANFAGAAYVFFRSGTVWTQQAYLKASNTNPVDQFGSYVAVSSNILVICAFREDGGSTGVNGNESDNSASGSGAAYVFERNGTTWVQQAYLKASNTEAFDQFGYSVAVSGNTIVAGANFESSSAAGVNGDQSDNNADQSGAAYVFEMEAPLSVELLYFQCAPFPNGLVRLTWATASELDNAGFNVYRMEVSSTPLSAVGIPAVATKVNYSMVPATGGPASGANYSLRDWSTHPGTRYYYWLEDIDILGVSTVTQPVLVTTFP